MSEKKTSWMLISLLEIVKVSETIIYELPKMKKMGWLMVLEESSSLL